MECKKIFVTDFQLYLTYKLPSEHVICTTYLWKPLVETLNCTCWYIWNWIHTIVHYCAFNISELPLIGARVEMSILEASSWSTNRTWCNPHFLLERVSVFKVTKFLSMQIRERKFPFFFLVVYYQFCLWCANCM